MAMEITQILLAAQSADGQNRTGAEENLKQLQQQNLPLFILSLSTELSNEDKPPESCRLAGLILKNSLYAKDAALREELTQSWVTMDSSIKSQVKESLLQTLASLVSEARHTSCQVIAKVASIEIPRHEWQDLIERLLNNIAQQDAPAQLKQATLEALGYVCEEISPQYLEQEQVNDVLTAVVQSMNQMEHSYQVRLAAVKALYNALDFARSNFENKAERDFIMNVVCETSEAPEPKIRQAAFECLVSIASTYYGYLEPYLDILVKVTTNTVREDEEPIALQAIEFWSSICDEEIKIQEKSKKGINLIKQSIYWIVPLMLETLLPKQEEHPDPEERKFVWSFSMAGQNCLMLIATTVGDAIVPLVERFLKINAAKDDLRSREAAIFISDLISYSNEI